MLNIEEQKPLSVCFFSHSALLVGAERSLLELVIELIEDHGVACSVILPGDGPLKEKLEGAGASTHIVDYSWWFDLKILPEQEVDYLCSNSVKNLLYHVKQVLNIMNPDVIVTNTMVIPWGAITASFLGKPHVWFIHEFGEAVHGLKPFLPFNVTLDFVKNLSSLILTNSDAVKKTLFPDMSSRNVQTVYQYMDIPATALRQDEGSYFTGTDSTRLIMVGTVQEGKGQKDAILAVRELVRRGRDVELVIIGHWVAEHAEYLMTVIREEGLEEHVKFIGFKENPYPVVNQADIVLVCSRNEAFGRVTVEGMLLKKPVIGTNSGGTLELIKEGFNGLLYEPGDYRQLADKIEYLIDHKDEARRLAENGYKFASKAFTRDKFGGKVYRLLRNLKSRATSQASFSNLDLKGPATLDGLLSAAAAKDPKIAALITELGSSLAARDLQVSELEQRLQAKDSRIAELGNVIQAKDAQINDLTYALQTKDAQINDLTYALQTKDAQIQQINRGIVVQLVNRYQRAVEKLLHPETRRRYYYELMLTAIRVILNEGWKRLFKEMGAWRLRRAMTQATATGLPKFETSISRREAEKLSLPEMPRRPRVSIVIAVYNKWQYTLNCLKTICQSTDGDYEVIVVDDASSDDTAKILSKVKNLVVLRNKKNVGFIESCNRGAKTSKGKYVLFLNNDTMVTKGWLPPLLEIIEKEDVGAVGAKLVYPNGTLQEAGAIVWSDGTASNYGRGDHQAKPEYNFVREVDYCSGACLLVKRELIQKSNGFDERFKPGYYEDADLCFAIREMGYKVMYQPKSVIVHFEGVTCGTDVASGIKKYQEINRAKFVQKWATILKKSQYEYGLDKLFMARDRRPGRRILAMDQWVPRFDKDAGSLRMSAVLKILSDLGHRVTFIGRDLLRTEPYTGEFQGYGVEVVYAPYILSIEQYIEEFGKYFDIFFLSRPVVAKKYIDLVQQTCPGAKIIHDTVDLVSLRLSRRAELEKDEKIQTEADEAKAVELYLARRSDVTLVVSYVEKDLLLKEIPSLKVEVVSLIHDVTKPKKSFSERRDILYIGGFDHMPNIDAVKFFIDEILPIVRQKVPDAHFYVVGNIPSPHPAEAVLSLCSKDVTVTGYVKDVTQYFESCRVFVAPLRYGAGVKGKITHSMSYGLPVITTSVGAEGAHLTDGDNVLIADAPEDFAEKVVLLYNNEDLWNKLSRNSIKTIKKYFSYSLAKKQLGDIIDSLVSINAG